MKKIFMLLMILMATSLTGCDAGVVTDVKKLEKISAKIDEIVADNVSDLTLEERLEESDNGLGPHVDEVYYLYMNDTATITGVKNAFLAALLEGKITIKQVDVINETLDSLTSLENAETQEDVYYFFLDALYDVKFSSDQLVTIAYSFVSNMQDAVIAELDKSPYKDEAEYVYIHQLVVDEVNDSFEEGGEFYQILSYELTQYKNLAKIVVNGPLDYFYSMYSNKDIFKKMESTINISADDYKVIIKAQVTAFKESFGKMTQKDLENALTFVFEIVEESSDSLDSSALSFKEMLTVEEYAQLVYKMISSIEKAQEALVVESTLNYYVNILTTVGFDLTNVTEVQNRDIVIIASLAAKAGLTASDGLSYQYVKDVFAKVYSDAPAEIITAFNEAIAQLETTITYFSDSTLGQDITDADNKVANALTEAFEKLNF